MIISNEKVTVVVGFITDEKVLDALKGTWNLQVSNNVELTFNKIADDLYEAKLWDDLKIMATVTPLTKSKMFSQITTFILKTYKITNAYLI